MSIYLETLCWKEVLQKFNTRGVGIKMSWLEKVWKWGGRLLGTKQYFIDLLNFQEDFVSAGIMYNETSE